MLRAFGVPCCVPDHITGLSRGTSWAIHYARHYAWEAVRCTRQLEQHLRGRVQLVGACLARRQQHLELSRAYALAAVERRLRRVGDARCLQALGLAGRGAAVRRGTGMDASCRSSKQPRALLVLHTRCRLQMSPHPTHTRTRASTHSLPPPHQRMHTPSPRLQSSSPAQHTAPPTHPPTHPPHTCSYRAPCLTMASKSRLMASAWSRLAASGRRWSRPRSSISRSQLPGSRGTAAAVARVVQGAGAASAGCLKMCVYMYSCLAVACGRGVGHGQRW